MKRFLYILFCLSFLQTTLTHAQKRAEKPLGGREQEFIEEPIQPIVKPVEPSKPRKEPKEPKAPKEPRVRKEHPAPFVGLNAGIGVKASEVQASFDGIVGLDMAAHITDKFAMGFHLSYQTLTDLTFGPLFVHGDYTQGKAFIWGVGFTQHIGGKDKRIYSERYPSLKWTLDPNYSLGGDIHIGGQITPNWYLVGNVELGFIAYDIRCSETLRIYYPRNNYYNDYRYNDFHYDHYKPQINLGITVGYKFSINKKSKEVKQ